MRVSYGTYGPSAQDYLSFYRRQAGNGLPIYSGPVYQRGTGLFSNIFRGITNLFSKAPSWLKSGAKFLGRQAVSTGADLVRDMAENTDEWNTDWRRAAKRKMKEAGANLLEQGAKEVRSQLGTGKRKRNVVSRKSTSKKKASPKKKLRQHRRTKEDIFV